MNETDSFCPALLPVNTKREHAGYSVDMEGHTIVLLTSTQV